MRYFRALGCLLVFPMVLMASALFLSNGNILPVAFTPTRDKDQILAAVNVLTELSAFLQTASLSLIALSAVLVKFPNDRGLDGMGWGLALTGFFSAALSIFLGYRFQMDVAVQLAFNEFVFNLVAGRLKVQAMLCLASLVALFALGVDRFFAGPKELGEEKLWFRR